MKTRAEHAKALRGNRATQFAQFCQHVIGAVADARLQLDLFGEDLSGDPLCHGGRDPLEDRLALRDQPVSLVDQQKLLLDAKRERRRAAEVVVVAIRCDLSLHA
jgi:hypothetical protein